MDDFNIGHALQAVTRKFLYTAILVLMTYLLVNSGEDGVLFKGFMGVVFVLGLVFIIGSFIFIIMTLLKLSKTTLTTDNEVTDGLDDLKLYKEDDTVSFRTYFKKRLITYITIIIITIILLMVGTNLQ